MIELILTLALANERVCTESTHPEGSGWVLVKAESGWRWCRDLAPRWTIGPAARWIAEQQPLPVEERYGIVAAPYIPNATITPAIWPPPGRTITITPSELEPFVLDLPTLEAKDKGTVLKRGNDVFVWDGHEWQRALSIMGDSLNGPAGWRELPAEERKPKTKR